MAVYFFDTSALVKYYHTEIGSSQITALVESSDHQIHISRLSHVEWLSAFARHVRTKEITAAEFKRLRSRFYADLKARIFRISSLRN